MKIAPDLGVDLRDVPAYSYAEGARIVDLPVSTLRAWALGQSYDGGRGFFEPVLRPPTEGYGAGLTYYNLVEATVLRALRTGHRVPMEEVRQAIARAQREFNIDRLFIHESFRVTGRELFLRIYSRLVNLGKSDQMVIDDVLEHTLWRVKYDENRLVLSHYPLTRGSPQDDPKIIEINPFVSFGRAIVARRGISTRAIVSRIDAGESLDHIAEDYGLELDEIREAQRFEARMTKRAA